MSMRDVAGQLVAAGPRAVDALVERAEKAERELDEAEDRVLVEHESLLNMRRQRDELQAYVSEALIPTQVQLQADLDAALNWIEHDEDESIPPAGLWQRVKALLEKRRVERGNAIAHAERIRKGEV